MRPAAVLLACAHGTLAWDFKTPPGAPGNISVGVSPHQAEIRWRHAEDESVDLPTHYVVKWQAMDDDEVNWHPDWIGVGDELVTLHGLRPGATYALRIAAINAHGRAWSAAAVFRTISAVLCAETHHWQPLLDEADIIHVCRAEHAARLSAPDDDPDSRGACSAGWTEYILAGVAAGATMVAILLAVILDRPGVSPVYFAETPARRPQYFGMGGSAHFDGVVDPDESATAQPAPPQQRHQPLSDPRPSPISRQPEGCERDRAVTQRGVMSRQMRSEVPRPALSPGHVEIVTELVAAAEDVHSRQPMPPPAATASAGPPPAVPLLPPPAAESFLTPPTFASCGEAAGALGEAAGTRRRAVGDAACAPDGGALEVPFQTPTVRAIEIWDEQSPRIALGNDAEGERPRATSNGRRPSGGTPPSLTPTSSMAASPGEEAMYPRFPQGAA